MMVPLCRSIREDPDVSIFWRAAETIRRILVWIWGQGQSTTYQYGHFELIGTLLPVAECGIDT